MTPTPDDAAMPDELLNPKIYPERMYMDCYGNGHHSWDRKQHPDMAKAVDVYTEKGLLNGCTSHVFRASAYMAI